MVAFWSGFRLLKTLTQYPIKYIFISVVSSKTDLRSVVVIAVP